MTNNDPLTDPDKAFGELQECSYKAEVELVEKYQSFVAEILRLSLLGIAVFGYLYKDVFHMDSAQSGANIRLSKNGSCHWRFDVWCKCRERARL